MSRQKSSMLVIEEHVENSDTKNIMDEKNYHLNVLKSSFKNQSDKPFVAGACSSSTCCCSSC